MKKIAITGNIASGKSQVEKILSDKGYIVFDTDLIVHDILIDKPDVGEAFSEYDVFEFGRLSRRKLGDLVFSDDDLKKKLENIVHPIVLDEINQIFDTYKNEDYIFISIPLLFEVGWANMFDNIIFIASDDDIRLERLIKRNNLSKEESLKRLNSQLDQADKIKESDYIIYNNSTIDDLKKSVEDVVEKIAK